LLALAFLPARAGESKSGTILMANAGSPAVPRLGYVLTQGNVGDEPTRTYALGYVTRVSDDSFFKIAPAVPGSVGDFDIFFYAADPNGDYPGAALPNEVDANKWANPGPACDQVPATAKWAIVTLAVGAPDQFTLTFSNTALSC
jgi:hypothetical protein